MYLRKKEKGKGKRKRKERKKCKKERKKGRKKGRKKKERKKWKKERKKEWNTCGSIVRRVSQHAHSTSYSFFTRKAGFSLFFSAY